MSPNGRNRVKTMLAVLATLLLAPAAHADGYGGNPPAEQRRMVRMVRHEFGHGRLGDTMLCIARRESGLNPRAANWTDSHGGSFGLFQLNGVHSPRGWAYRAWVRRMWNPAANIAAARRLYDAAGLGPWGGGC